MERTADIAARLTGDGYAADPLPFDVADEGAAVASFARIEQRFKKLDILVANVGMRLREPLDRISTADFQRMLAVNVASTFALTKLAAGLMAPQRYGRIIMVTSLAGILGRAGDAAYIASKAGMTGMMRAFACEFGPMGITCNAIAPGPFETESNIAIPPERKDWVRRRVPLQRPGNPPEIAGPAVFLASDAASYVNGHVLTVDGGYSIAF